LRTWLRIQAISAAQIQTYEVGAATTRWGIISGTPVTFCRKAHTLNTNWASTIKMLLLFITA